jgi:vacuolar-type H+-ATPase subunit H
MDLATGLQQLEELVTQAKSMPLSSSALLNREEVLELLAQMRESLPEEIKQARWIVKDREDLLAKARHDVDALLEKARSEQLRMASREEVVRRAKDEAERVLAEAEKEARETRLEAEDYVDSKLAQFEIVLNKIQDSMRRSAAALHKTVDQVGAGRDRLRGMSHPAGQLAPAPEEPAVGEQDEQGEQGEGGV